ncbi:hypothetical protein K7I13_09900 [Brucepastera parasyntrophica]|uniref:hypothetical protein n=1 Tax=Brucepastera parasyntrophica TaxID=2880008 RepID=UPI0021087FBF|nr:hypothetical protein [Brucepastera parasyntrophica]ULQ58844.1 hypothetical protein K7I13_09900 [Brucepastera parasyntrophica]
MNSENIRKWQESLLQLSDKYFFDLVRLYLGAVKTPYNKQRLVEELTDFLRKKKIRYCLLVSLDNFDLLILSAISELPYPTLEKISAFFSGSYTYSEIHERILNLEERLIIFRENEVYTRAYALNPVLANDILPLLDPENLIPPAVIDQPFLSQLLFDDLTLTALLSLFLHTEIAVTGDGSLRKKNIDLIKQVFPQFAENIENFLLIIKALQQLGLLAQQEDRLAANVSQWKAFAFLSFEERLAYIAAAADGNFSRDILQQRAQQFRTFLAECVPGARYKKETIDRMIFLLAEKSALSGLSAPRGRLASMLQENRKAPVNTSSESSRMSYIDIALLFGYLDERDGLITVNTALFQRPPDAPEKNAASKLVVSPAFTITLMPGFTLSEMIDLACCAEIRSLQTVAQFELTKTSCINAFYLGENAEKLVKTLQEKSEQPLPGNVVFSIQDWYRGFSSAALFQGFVLSIDESRRTVFENNPYFNRFVRETLAPGVYLLEAESKEDLKEFFDAAGLNFLQTKAASSPGKAVPFLRSERKKSRNRRNLHPPKKICRKKIPVKNI